MAGLGGGFNWSLQHLISNYLEEDVENEVSNEDLLKLLSYKFTKRMLVG
jgi:hypothetical protein